MGNKINKLLVILFVLSFIELQVLLFFVIKNNIDINKITNNPSSQENFKNQDFGGFNRGMPPDMDGDFNDDISENAITPEKDNTTTKKSKSNNNT